MLNRLIQLALTQRILMALLTVVLIAGGWMAFKTTPIDAFPDVSTTQVKIIIKAPGMTPEEVEARITSRIELEMLGIPNQKVLRSMSKYAITDITIDFKEGTDIYWARQQVSERLGNIWADLPAGIDGGLAPLTTPLGDMFMFTLSGDSQTNAEKRELLDWVIRPALRAVPGVADVNALGGEVRAYTIVPDWQAMKTHQVSLEHLLEVVERNNLNDGAGRVSQGEEVLLVRSQGRIQTLDDLGNLVVKGAELDEQGELSRSVMMSDIADLRFEGLTRYGGVTENGEGEVVQGLVMSLRGANARKVVEGVEAAIEQLQPALPDGLSLDVFYNRGDLVERAVNTVAKALFEAVVLVLILLVVFLGNLRAALTVALVLPLAALMTFILMKTYGLSANLMSLGGLAIAIGMLVDAAVVVVENIVIRQAHAQSRLPKLHVIYRAVQEVSVPVITGILIIMLVFVPLLTLEGLEGKLFKPVALTIVFALGSSLILSLTVIPLLASFLLGEVSHKEPWLVRKLTAVYRPTLNWALTHDKGVLAVALVALLGAGVVYTQVGKTFMPTMDEGDILLQLEKIPAIDLESSLYIDQQVQKAILQQVPEVKRIVARAGSDELGMDPMNLNDTDSFLVLKPRDEWRMETKAELEDAIRQVVEQFPGVNYNFTQPIQMRVDEMLTGARGDLAIKIFGDDPDALNRIAQQVVTKVEKIEGAQDVFTPVNDGAKYLQISYDPKMLAQLGLSVEQVSRVMSTQLEGEKIGVVYEGSRAMPLLVRADASIRSAPEVFLQQPVVLPNGQSMPLSQLAKVEWVVGPVSVQREQGQRFSIVVANVTGRDLVGFVEEAKVAVSDLDMPAGYYFSWGGQFENQQRAAKRLALVVPISLGFIFLLLFITFRSTGLAAMVLTNIPLALIGGIGALWLTGEYLSVPASVGFIALLGIAVLNGVVMVSYFNQLWAKGLSIHEVVIEGAMRRLRPVMMTASIAALGLVPLVFATGPGSEIQRPLAIVVIGGLFTSTLLTLLVLPILYHRFAPKLLPRGNHD
ncbi:efflux RND transporter permease subunit [Thiomicrospira pelophila]|uniref:efflux RND transporter permease subunit n=1 Tax=Thiomicrospira pelophila TaxID=934 RepID=UPI0004A72C56|nr:CusA/CzcA family heavy metal efflux RND transporter [Thiomicrospira pelophila]